ncbi:hypothetical protein QQS21_009600 [Conoideocrella luteorostrata]|uniref:DJ-1/PfpI domain-containing protein n=1 Tax=Conoideocrella luteorostrata TaxID=1105319 RepID=A0AAJ0CJC3_9HYPO|nr:hypothetical protein QQS21_009600 [Conoideocrella luteorostrata]
MSPFDLSNPDRPVRVGVILMNGVTELLDVAPIDLFHGMSKAFTDQLIDEFITPAMRSQALDMECIWVSEVGPTDQNRLTSGLNITPTHSFEDCPPLDIAIIGANNFGYTPNETELDFVRKTYSSCSAFITVCGGMVVPLRAGVLSGKTATAPRFMLDMLKEQSPEVQWVEKRWVRDGKLWTSGALLNGMDLGTAFVQEVWAERKELVDFLLRVGSWVSRDLDYKDGF